MRSRDSKADIPMLHQIWDRTCRRIELKMSMALHGIAQEDDEKKHSRYG